MAVVMVMVMMPENLQTISWISMKPVKHQSDCVLAIAMDVCSAMHSDCV
jgi:hypothetical protein